MTDTIHTSRVFGLFSLSPTKLLFPHRMTCGEDGITTTKVRFFLFPWVKVEEHAAFGRVASIVHNKGFIWDVVVVETTGGSNNLDVRGVAKGPARAFVAAVQARLEGR